MTPPTSEPGYHARWFAKKIGWAIDRYTLVVEGNHDDRYARLADRLHYDRYAKRLITPGMTIFPAGDGPGGGTKRILRDFHIVQPALRILA